MLNSGFAGDYSWNGNEINVLFRNDGDGHNPEVGFISGAGVKEDSRSFVLGDFDNDGDLDIVTNSLATTAKYLENKVGQKQHWFEAKLQGVKSNRDGVGARMTLTAAGHKQIREFHIGYSYLSQGHGFRNYFGLAGARKIDELTIRWPSGIVDAWKNLPVDRIMSFKEGSSPASTDPGLVKAAR